MTDQINPCVEIADQMTEWRHDLHRNPELGFEEFRTADLVASLLSDFGLQVHTEVGRTGVVGILQRGNNGKSIGMRADMDALAIVERNEFAHKSQHEGRMHACGHDGHTAMLLGAARTLAEAGDFDGTAVFIFQPAEEHGRGALAMMEDGLFTRFPMDAVYAIHNLPSLPVGQIALRAGPIMASEDNFAITITGKGGHAAMPQACVDPIVVGSETVLALQNIVSRTLNPTDNAVISITDFDVDATRNVISENVTLRGDTRTFTTAVQDHVEQSMQRIANGVCLAHGASCQFVYTREFASTINTKDEAEIAAAVAQSVVGAANVEAACAPLMASEDFGFMLQKKPGCYLFLGNGGDGPGGCGLHSPNYDFNDQILPIGANFWVRLVESQLAV